MTRASSCLHRIRGFTAGPWPPWPSPVLHAAVAFLLTGRCCLSLFPLQSFPYVSSPSASSQSPGARSPCPSSLVLPPEKAPHQRPASPSRLPTPAHAPPRWCAARRSRAPPPPYPASPCSPFLLSLSNLFLSPMDAWSSLAGRCAALPRGLQMRPATPPEPSAAAAPGEQRRRPAPFPPHGLQIRPASIALVVPVPGSGRSSPPPCPPVSATWRPPQPRGRAPS
ncbi:vegetative cell wall protein gp1-like [Triticum dicoccoides]|uniref:vegetative cell wall protein gp1-like n=1 Tax=Triticum dicoccoides TaxID=85692 RepID=UPI00188F9CD5|nr:vegetative cell wall protein gp1-like [Triticum dicoccoides]